MNGFVLFALLLPCATWWLGSVLGLLDGAEPGEALGRIAWRSLPFVAAAAVAGNRAAWPALAAVTAALTLHVLWSIAARQLAGRRVLHRPRAEPGD